MKLFTKLLKILLCLITLPIFIINLKELILFSIGEGALYSANHDTIPSIICVLYILLSYAGLCIFSLRPEKIKNHFFKTFYISLLLWYPTWWFLMFEPARGQYPNEQVLVLFHFLITPIWPAGYLIKDKFKANA